MPLTEVKARNTMTLMPDTNTVLRSIPAMEELLNLPWAFEFSARVGRDCVKKAITEALDVIRRELNAGKYEIPVSGTEAAKAAINELVARHVALLL